MACLKLVRLLVLSQLYQSCQFKIQLRQQPLSLPRPLQRQYRPPSKLVLNLPPLSPLLIKLKIQRLQSPLLIKLRPLRSLFLLRRNCPNRVTLTLALMLLILKLS